MKPKPKAGEIMIVTSIPGSSSKIRNFIFKSELEMSGAFQARSDDSRAIEQQNADTMPIMLFEVMYDLVDGGPAISVVAFKQGEEVCLSVFHSDSERGWTEDEEEDVKELIKAAFL